MPHVPVLLQTVCEYLEPKPGDLAIDATAGQGGYSRALISLVSPGGKVLMIDWDEQAVAILRVLFAREISAGIGSVAQGNFRNIRPMAEGQKMFPANRIVFDFGTSRLTLKEFGKGFSFEKDEPLRMTYSVDAPEDAAQVVNSYSEKELKRIFSEYGQERFSGRIATAIIRARNRKKIESSRELAEIIVQAVPFRSSRLHPATRVFQALRIHVNQELENITEALPQAMALLAPGGRMAAVSYHSLEDRIVKQAFREFGKSGIGMILTPKPITPDGPEINRNPSSRSAKLRAIEKI